MPNATPPQKKKQQKTKTTKNKQQHSDKVFDEIKTKY